jgi:phosphohistidine phosphatase
VLPTGQPQVRTGLGPTDPLEQLAPEPGFWSADTLIVGHLPYLGRLASLLLVSDPDRPTLAFQPGSLACLERDADGSWVLDWMLRPELLAPARR